MTGKNSMRDQVLSLPGMIQEVFWRVEADARLVVPTPEIYSTTDVVLTGCGDSLAAAMAAAPAFMELGRVRARALSAMEASRYTAGLYVTPPEKNTLALGISNSGEAARAVEAVLAYAARGANTLALTANPESRMGKAAHKVLRVQAPAGPGGPGVRGFVLTGLALCLLAIRFGEVKGAYTMDEAGAMRKELFGCGDILDDAFRQHAGALEAFARQCSDHGDLEILSCGPCRGAGEFGAAKVVEALGARATSVDLEEFGHGSFFRAPPAEIPTVLLAPGAGRALSRSLEIAGALRVLGRPYLILTDGGGEAFRDHGRCVVSVARPLRELFAPLVYAPLLALMVCAMDGCDDSAYFRGHRGVWDEKDIVDVKRSEIVV